MREVLVASIKVTVLVLAVKVPALDQLPVTYRLVVPESDKVPAEIVTAPTVELLPDKVSADVAEFCVMPVTFVPITELMVTAPAPEPELVMVPVLFTEVVERRIASAVALLLLSIKLPVPVVPPETVSILVPAVLVSVVLELFTVIAVVLIVKADVVLFRVMPVTLEPTPPLMVTVPVPALTFVIVPTLFTDAVESVSVNVLLPLSVRLFVPVTPPLNMAEVAEG